MAEELVLPDALKLQHGDRGPPTPVPSYEVVSLAFPSPVFFFLINFFGVELLYVFSFEFSCQGAREGGAVRIYVCMCVCVCVCVCVLGQKSRRKDEWG